MFGETVFIDIGAGWHVNLAQVARIHVVDSGGIGTTLKFYSPANEHLGDFTPATPEELTQMLQLIDSFGKQPAVA